VHRCQQAGRGDGWLTRCHSRSFTCWRAGYPDWPSWCSAATGRRMPSCWCSGTRTRCCAAMSAGCGTSRTTGRGAVRLMARRAGARMRLQEASSASAELLWPACAGWRACGPKAGRAARCPGMSQCLCCGSLKSPAPAGTPAPARPAGPVCSARTPAAGGRLHDERAAAGPAAVLPRLVGLRRQAGMLHSGTGAVIASRVPGLSQDHRRAHRISPGMVVTGWRTRRPAHLPRSVRLPARPRARRPEDLVDNPEETDDLLRLGLHRLPITEFPLLCSLAPVLASYDGAAELGRGLDILLTGLTTTLTPQATK
jgi:hypothetical protein